MIEFGKINPMLAPHDIAQPFNDPDCLYEIKWNGVRCILWNDGKRIRLQNRNGGEITHQFPEIVEGAKLRKSCVLDGEIVVPMKGIPDWSLIQKRIHLENTLQIKLRANKRPACFQAFDCLAHDMAVTKWPLTTRRQILSTLVEPNDVVQVSLAFSSCQSYGELLLLGHEGMMAKQLNSQYTEGIRSSAWRKIKPTKKGTYWIVGYTQGEGWRSELGALLLAELENGAFRYVGKVGSGLTMDVVTLLLSILPNLTAEISPVVNPNGDGRVTWVVPSLRCEVAYMDITAEGKLYQPRFKKLIE